METYVTAAKLLCILAEDGHDLDASIEVELNENGEIKYTHFYV